MVAIGTEFDSYGAFLGVFESFKAENRLKYSVGTSRLLKSTYEKPIEAHIIDRFKYSYRRYKCTKCAAGLSFKFIDTNGIYKLRITAFEVEHEHASPQLDGRAHVYEKLDSIRNIVGQMPIQNVPFAEQMISNLLQILKNCPEIYVAEQYIKTGKIFVVLYGEALFPYIIRFEYFQHWFLIRQLFLDYAENENKDNKNNPTQPTSTATRYQDCDDDLSVDPDEIEVKSEMVLDNEANSSGNHGRSECNFGEGQVEKESANYSTEIIEIKPDWMWADVIIENGEPSIHIIDTAQENDGSSEVSSATADLGNTNGDDSNSIASIECQHGEH